VTTTGRDRTVNPQWESRFEMAVIASATLPRGAEPRTEEEAMRTLIAMLAGAASSPPRRA
jgi:hypothetical protein